MAVVTELNCYPVKGCKGISLQQASLLETGLLHDRHWMVVDAQGCFVTQRQLPRMALIGTAFDHDRLSLTAPGCPPLEVASSAPGEPVGVTVWRDACRGSTRVRRRPIG